MNAQHPTRAAFGDLAKVAPTLDALDPLVDVGAAYARGKFAAALPTLDHLTFALEATAEDLAQAIASGAGRLYELDRLEGVMTRLADAVLKAETATSQLTGRMYGDRARTDVVADVARAAGIDLERDGGDR